MEIKSQHAIRTLRLKMKAEGYAWLNAAAIEVNAARVAAENRPTQARFKCVGCGYENHADVVGAMNILARGHRVAACGEEGSGLGRKTRTKPASVKQEPTEVTMGELAHA